MTRLGHARPGGDLLRDWRHRLVSRVPTDRITDPVEHADWQTSMADLRTAFSLARGFRPDEISPLGLAGDGGSEIGGSS